MVVCLWARADSNIFKSGTGLVLSRSDACHEEKFFFKNFDEASEKFNSLRSFLSKGKYVGKVRLTSRYQNGLFGLFDNFPIVSKDTVERAAVQVRLNANWSTNRRGDLI
jgi:hypothetical protein